MHDISSIKLWSHSFVCFFFFFFSSRRRHTRLTCDWSSDVCSSDLISRRAGSRCAIHDVTRDDSCAGFAKEARVLEAETTCCASDQHDLVGDTHCCLDRKSTRLNSSHMSISYAVFCLKKKSKLADRA